MRYAESVRGAIAVVFAGMVLALAPGSALASSQDVANTQALARATSTLLRSAHPDIHKGLAAAEGFAKRVAAQCPGVAAGSPQNYDSNQLDREIIGAMTVTGYGTAAGPIATFARTVDRLHWSNGKLTRAIRSFASKLKNISTLAAPNICADIQAWVSSSFATLPAGTIEFNKHYFGGDPDAEEVPLIIRLAEPYATPSEIPVLRRVERFESELGEAEAAAVESYSRLMLALNLQQ